MTLHPPWCTLRGMATLPEIRHERGAAGVRAAIAAAVETHATIKAAAKSLGVLPHVLRRAAKGVGLNLPSDPRGIPKGSPGYVTRWGGRAKPLETSGSEEK